MKTREELESIATDLVDAAFKVHSALGPGLMESAYQTCLVHELPQRGLAVACEVVLPVRYDGLELDAACRVDLILEQDIIVESKAVQALAPIHEAQLLTYLRLSKCRLGFLINWNVPRIRDGIKRMVIGL